MIPMWPFRKPSAPLYETMADEWGRSYQRSLLPTSPKPREGCGWYWVPNRSDRRQSNGGWWERPMTAEELAREPEERRKDAEFIQAMLTGRLRHVGHGNYE